MNNKAKLIGGLGIAAVAVIAIAAFLFFGKGSSSKLEVVAASQQGGSCMVTYFPKNGDINIKLNVDEGEEGEESGETFEATENDIPVDPNPENWRVMDIYGNEVEAKVEMDGDNLVIKAPDGGYKKGEIYVLDIGENARFEGEEFGDARHMVFGVERGESETIVFQDNVSVLEEPASLEGEEVTLSGKYKEGDIVIDDFDDDGIFEAIKLQSVTNEGETTKATFVEPTAEEVYKEIDIYTIKYADFSGGELAEGVEDTSGNLEMGMLSILDPITSKAYAEEEGETGNWTPSIDYGMRESEFNGNTTEAPYMTVGLGYKEGIVDASVTIDAEIPIIYVERKDVMYLDIDIRTKDTLEFNVGKELIIDPTKTTTAEMLEDYEANKGEALLELGGRKDIKSNIPVVVIYGIPVVTLDVFSEVGLDIGAKLENKLEANTSNYIRIWCKSLDEVGYKKDFSASGTLTNRLSGQVDIFAGLGIRISAGSPVLIELAGEASVGPYVGLKGAVQSEFSFNYPPPSYERSLTGALGIEAGLEGRLKAEVGHDGVFINKYKTFVDWKDRIKIFDYNTGKALMGLEMKEQWAVEDGLVEIGEIEAQFYDVISNETMTETLAPGSYELFVDGTKVDASGKLDDKQAALGNHNIKININYEGHDYEYEREVEFVEATLGELTVEAATAYLKWLEARESEIREIPSNYTYEDIKGIVAFADVGGDDEREMIYLQRKPYTGGNYPAQFALDIHIVQFANGRVTEITPQDDWMGQLPNSFKVVMQNVAGGAGGFALYRREGEKGVRLVKMAGNEAGTITYRGFMEDMITPASPSIFYYSNGYGGPEYVVGASGVATVSEEEWRKDYYSIFKSDIDYDGALLMCAYEGCLVTDEKEPCGLTYDEAIEYLRGNGAGRNESKKDDAIEAASGDDVAKTYVGVLDSLRLGDGEYSVNSYDGSVSPVEYTLFDIDKDKVPELLVGCMDEMDPGRRYISVFFYDSTAKNAILAEGGLAAGVAGAGGFRGSLGSLDDGNGGLDLIVSYWSSGTGEGTANIVSLNNGALGSELYTEFQFGTDNEHPETTPLEWTEIEDTSLLAQ